METETDREREGEQVRGETTMIAITDNVRKIVRLLQGRIVVIFDRIVRSVCRHWTEVARNQCRCADGMQGV